MFLLESDGFYTAVYCILIAFKLFSVFLKIQILTFLVITMLLPCYKLVTTMCNSKNVALEAFVYNALYRYS